MSSDIAFRCVIMIDPLFEIAQIIYRECTVAAAAMFHSRYDEQTEEILCRCGTTHRSIYRVVVVEDAAGELERVASALSNEQFGSGSLELSQIGVAVRKQRTHAQSLIVVIEVKITDGPVRPGGGVE